MRRRDLELDGLLFLVIRSRFTLQCMSFHEMKTARVMTDCFALAPGAFLCSGYLPVSVSFTELQVCWRLQATSLQTAHAACSRAGGSRAAQRAFMAQAVQQLLALECGRLRSACFWRMTSPAGLLRSEWVLSQVRCGLITATGKFEHKHPAMRRLRTNASLTGHLASPNIYGFFVLLTAGA